MEETPRGRLGFDIGSHYPHVLATILRLDEPTKDAIKPVETTRFADAGLRKRGDLQRILREKIEVVCPDTLVVR